MIIEFGFGANRVHGGEGWTSLLKASSLVVTVTDM